MTEPIHPTLPAPVAPGYDTQRVSTRGVFWFVIGFFVTGTLLLAIVWWIQGAFLATYPRPATPIAEALPLPQPLQPSPDHRALPWEDMAALRSAQQAFLNGYGPASSGHAHIPIGRAIDLLLDSGVLRQSWTNPATEPYQLETPHPQTRPSVENRT